MNVKQAKLAGLKAYEAGKARAPALNPEFIAQACGQSETKLVDLLAGYLFGFDIANLARDAIPGAPSLRSYAEIIAAN